MCLLCAAFLLLTACRGDEADQAPPSDHTQETTLPTAGANETPPPAIAAWSRDALFAAGYLGHYTEENARTFAEAFAAEHDLGTPEIVFCDGTEGYVIVPRYEGSSITLRTYNDADRLETELVTETDKAMILFCNPVDLTPNTELELNYGEDTIKLSPQLDPVSGDLLLPEQVQSITAPQQRAAEGAVASSMIGDWRALAKEGETGLGHYDMTIAANLTANVDLYMSYSDTEEPRRIADCTGRWQVSGDTAVFTWTAEGKILETTYRVQAEAGEWRTLVLTRISGEASFPLAETDGQVVFSQQI